MRSTILKQAGQLFADNAAHRRHHEMAVHDANTRLDAADQAGACDNGIFHAGLFLELCHFFRIAFELQRIQRLQLAKQLRKRVFIRNLTNACKRACAPQCGQTYRFFPYLTESSCVPHTLQK